MTVVIALVVRVAATTVAQVISCGWCGKPKERGHSCEAFVDAILTNSTRPDGVDWWPPLSS